MRAASRESANVSGTVDVTQLVGADTIHTASIAMSIDSGGALPGREYRARNVEWDTPFPISTEHGGATRACVRCAQSEDDIDQLGVVARAPGPQSRTRLRHERPPAPADAEGQHASARAEPLRTANKLSSEVRASAARATTV
jgi:hypothetical protein